MGPEARLKIETEAQDYIEFIENLMQRHVKSDFTYEKDCSGAGTSNGQFGVFGSGEN